MKKIILSMAVMCCTFLGMSQKNEKNLGETKRHANQHHPKFPKEKLNFTPQQNEQFAALNREFKTNMEALHKKENITVKQQRDDKATLIKKHREDINYMLTLEQKNTLEKLKSNEKKHKEERQANRLNGLKTKLNLTDEQIAKMKSNQAATHKQVEALKQNETMERSEKMRQMNEVKSKMKADFKNVLTADQRKQFEILKENRKEKMNKGRDDFKGKHHPSEVK